jgi:hypothetical protein
MERWWASDGAVERLGLVDGSNPAMGVSTAFLGLHGAFRAVLEPLASETLVDRRKVEEAFDGVDLQPVRRAVTAATSGSLGSVAAARYADLVVDDWRARGKDAAGRLTTTLVAKGLPWPRAVARVSSVAGVPIEQLGRYATQAAAPGLDAISASDIADRVLMDYAAQRGRMEPPAPESDIPYTEVSKRLVSKRTAERSAEHEVWEESDVKRDAHGRFATESSEADRKARADRLKARKKRRERRRKQAAATAAATSTSQSATRTQERRPREQARTTRAQERKKRKQLRLTRDQARSFRAKAEAAVAEQTPESAAAESMELPGARDPFGLKFRSLRHIDYEVDDKPFRPDVAFTKQPPHPEKVTAVWSSQDIIDDILPNIHDTNSWTIDHKVQINGPGTPYASVPLNFPDRGGEGYYSMVPKPDNLMAVASNWPEMYALSTAHPVIPNRAGFSWTVPQLQEDVGAYEVQVASEPSVKLVYGRVLDPATDEEVNVFISVPVFGVSILEKDVGILHKPVTHDSSRTFIKAAASATRERTAESWDESQVKRDSQGQFAEQSSDAERKARAERAKKRKARKKRRESRVRRAEAAAAANKQKTAPAGAKREQAKVKREQARSRRTQLRMPREQARSLRAGPVRSSDDFQDTDDSNPFGLQVQSLGYHTAPVGVPFTSYTGYLLEAPIGDEPHQQVYSSIDLANVLELDESNEAAWDVARIWRDEPGNDERPSDTEPFDSGTMAYELTPTQDALEGNLILGVPLVYRLPWKGFPLITGENGDVTTLQPGEQGIHFEAEFGNEASAEMWAFSAMHDSPVTGDSTKYVVRLPMLPVHVTDSLTGKVYKSSTAVGKASRSRSATAEQWDETLVNRDEKGQFASADAQAIAERKARAERRKKRRRRKERRAVLSARAQAADKERTASHPARGQGKSKREQERSQRDQEGKRRGQLRVRRTQQTRTRPKSEAVAEDEKPSGLASFTRKGAPEVGLYTLSEPLYSYEELDPSRPTEVMTEERMLSELRRHFNVPSEAQIIEGEVHYLPPDEPSVTPTVYRYEADTLPIAFRMGKGSFATATQSQLGQGWTSVTNVGDAHPVNFIRGAPGQAGLRDFETGHAYFVDVVSSFSKSVSKRAAERGRSATHEVWDETRVNRDAKGQFATSETEAAKKARRQRKARKERRRKRQERARAAQQASTGAQRQQERSARPQERQKRQQARAARPQARSRREQLSHNREQAGQASAAASGSRARTLTEARADPEHSSIGIWLGPAGRFPDPKGVAIGHMPLASAMMLESGQPVPMIEMLGEMPGTEREKASKLLKMFVTGPNQRDVSDVSGAGWRELPLVTVSLIRFAERWGATETWNVRTDRVQSEPYRNPREVDAPVKGVMIDEQGDRVLLTAPGRGAAKSQMKPLIVSVGSRVPMVQIEALANVIASGGTVSDPDTIAVAQRAWQIAAADANTEDWDVRELSDESLWAAIIYLSDRHGLVVDPLDDQAYEEAVAFALNKSRGRPVRLDDKGFFKITSDYDTTNGWEPV